MEKTNNNFEKIYANIKPEIIKLSENYKFLNLNEKSFTSLCEDLLKTIYNDNKSMELNQYIEIIKICLNEYATNNYINKFFKISIKDEENIMMLKRLDNFFEKNNIEVTPELYERILENDLISKTIETIINNNLEEIKEIGLTQITNNHNIIILLEMYCEKNNITFKHENLDLLNYMETDGLESQLLSSLGLYLNQISKKLLTKEEEQRLFELKEQGDETAVEKIAEHNLLLVVHIAKNHVGKGLDILDLIQEGNIGLITAIKKFDYRKGYKLSTYATWWIKQSIQRSIMNSARLIRLPVHICEKISKYSEVTSTMERELQRTPTKQEICQRMNITPEQIKELEVSSQSMISMNTLIGDDCDTETELGDFIPSEDESVEEQYIKSNLSEEIMHLLDKVNLSSREKMILLERFGFNDNKPKTLEEIASHLGLTRERVRQIEAKALRKIRMSPYLKRLASLSDYSLENNQYMMAQNKRRILK